MSIAMEKSQEIDQLAVALVKIQAEVGKIPKDASNPFFKSKYADLPAVIDKASPIVTKHGVAVTQWMGYVATSRDSSPGRDDVLTTMVVHESGQWMAASTLLHLVKDDPQAHGSAVTYARRYAYMAALGLVADEDDDGNRASFPKGAGASAPTSRPTRSATVPASPSKAVRPSPITEQEAVAKLEHAFGPDQDIIPDSNMQRAIYNKARKIGLSGGELNELCVAAVGCSFNEIDTGDKANAVMQALQASEQTL